MSNTADFETVSIRVAGREDVVQALACWQLARSPAAATPDDAESVSRLIDHDAAAPIFAECNGQVVGTLLAGWDGWRGNMYRLAVLTQFRRRRVATRLKSRQGSIALLRSEQH